LINYDGIEILKEEIDAKFVRPCPPEVQIDARFVGHCPSQVPTFCSFKTLQEVD